MNLKAVFKWFYEKIINYNLFMLDEYDYEGSDTIKDPILVLTQEKYKTRLYIILLAVCLYVLFYGNLTKLEPKTVVIANITPDRFGQLYFEYNQTLSCPCSTTTIPYSNFVVKSVAMHSVCSSVFVSKEWIEGLYLIEASLYNSWDFRKSAYSQFELLSRLCSLSDEIVFQLQTDVNNTQLLTINLLSIEQIQMEINNTIEFQRKNAFGQIVSFLNFWQTTIQRNYLASALGTNWFVFTDYRSNDPSIWGFPTPYPSGNESYIKCDYNYPVIPAFLPPRSNDSKDFEISFNLIPNSTIVKGFSITCTPLDALLGSTLDCLYDTECIQLLVNYFPNLTLTNINWTNSTLTSQHDNHSVLHYFENLFIKTWLPSMNYAAYFNQCSPSMCTYTTTDNRSLSYTITLFISLYGGLIIILRSVASYSIDILFKCTHRQNNSNENLRHRNRNMFKTFTSIKEMNFFKNINDRTAKGITQQKIITRVYLILLLISMCIVCLYTSLNNENVITIQSHPSLTTYNSLDSQYSSILQCPCANKAIPYRTFLSLSPIFHQICLSSFVTNEWIIQMMSSAEDSIPYDWRHGAFKYFQILSDLCQVANRTSNVAIDKFLAQFFIASSVMNQNDFEKQLDAYVKQVYQSTIYTFDLMK
ncbi:unnamed protein product, partial [Adineta ricciae]